MRGVSKASRPASSSSCCHGGVGRAGGGKEKVSVCRLSVASREELGRTNQGNNTVKYTYVWKIKDWTSAKVFKWGTGSNNRKREKWIQ